MTRISICIYITCAKETRRVTNHQQQAAALPVAFTSSLTSYKKHYIVEKK